MVAVMEIREIPCGNCNCGVYSEMALLNPKARELGSYPTEERRSHINPCKKDPTVLCAGESDYCDYIESLDKAYHKVMS